VVLVPDAVAIVLLAPAMSIVAATRRDCHASATLLPALGAVLVLVVVSIAATLGTSSSASSAIATIAMPHATLAAAALASAALGALCGRFFDDVLDAAAVSGVLVVAATFALLVAGDLVVGLPTAVVDAGLTASPLVAMASAAEFDLLRSDTWYHASPIAHRSFSYPLWSHATGSYILVSIICAIVFIRKTERSS
jgi:hypothetical protein